MSLGIAKEKGMLSQYKQLIQMCSKNIFKSETEHLASWESLKDKGLLEGEGLSTPDPNWLDELPCISTPIRLVNSGRIPIIECHFGPMRVPLLSSHSGCLPVCVLAWPLRIRDPHQTCRHRQSLKNGANSSSSRVHFSPCWTDLIRAFQRYKGIHSGLRLKNQQ